jgi:hypothetical protein
MTADPPAQASPDRDVFISYASPDATVANAFVETLECSGFTCWISPGR